MNDFALSPGWAGNLDWVVFSGLVAWTLAAVAAFKIGSPGFGLPQKIYWLYIGGFAVSSALGMAALLLHFYYPQSRAAPIAAVILTGVAGWFLLLRAAPAFGSRQRSLALIALAGVLFGIGLGIVNISCARFEFSASFPGHGARSWFSRPVLAMGSALLLSVPALILSCWVQSRFLASLPAPANRRVDLHRKVGWYAVILVLVMALGFTATRWREREFVSEQSERLVWRVSTAALGLDLNAMLRLSGRSADQKMPAFATLNRQLEKLMGANADIRSAYLWALRDGKVIFLAYRGSSAGDHYPPGVASPDRIVHRESDFDRAAPYTTRSERGPSGAIVTANQRINNPTNQLPFAWLALDFEAGPWLRSMADTRLEAIAATYLAVLVVTACYGWITRIEIERDSEREKLALVEAERERFARDLHDGLGQTLTGLAYRTKALSVGLSGPPAEQASEIAGMLSAAVGEARAIAFAEIPPSLKRGGLTGGLEWLAGNIRQLFGIEFRLEIPPNLPDFPERTSHALLQITREAAHNAIRHGRARAVTVRLEREPAGWRFDILDDGGGLPPIAGDPVGLGRRMINRRIEELGGKVEFLKNAPTGVVVHCRFPSIAG